MVNTAYICLLYTYKYFFMCRHTTWDVTSLSNLHNFKVTVFYVLNTGARGASVPLIGFPADGGMVECSSPHSVPASVIHTL